MKYMKMAAIAMMALALFSCKNKNNEPSVEASALSLRINDSELRALEPAIAGDTETNITKDVTIKLFPSEREIHLSEDQIREAKTATGTRIKVGETVTHVSIVNANAEITDATEITDWQSKAGKFTTDIPLTAPKTAVDTPTKDGDDIIYSVTLSPVPAFARLEVFGKIKGQENATSHKNAFDDISVEAVYINNYLLTRNATKRYFTAGENKAFAATPELKGAMMDDNVATQQADFEAGKVVAGYQLFPKNTKETIGDELCDHVILKLNIKYSAAAQAAGLPATATRFVTITQFMKATTGDLKSFEAGNIYKLDLKELNEHFKTSEDGTPDPSNPDKEDPEQKGDKILVVKVIAYKWTAVNIKPDLFK